MKSIPRNPYALLAKMRRASIFHHRNDPRGGSKNSQKDLLAEWNYVAPFWFEDVVDFIWESGGEDLSFDELIAEFIFIGVPTDILSKVTNQIYSVLSICENKNRENISNILANVLKDVIC